jgi:hypothetical protein
MPPKEVFSMSVTAREISVRLAKKELAFLKEMADNKKIHYFFLERATIDTGNLHPVEDKGHSGLSKRIYLLDNTGNLLDEVGLKPVESKPKRRPSSEEQENPRHEETVNEALLRLGEKADKVQYILFFREASGTSILYQCPEGFTVKTWLDQGCVEPVKEGEVETTAETILPATVCSIERPGTVD